MNFNSNNNVSKPYEKRLSTSVLGYSIMPLHCFQGSYFDVSNNVDRERNRQMWALSKGFKVQTWENPPETTVVQPKREKGSLRDELFALENNILDSLVKNLSQDFSRQLKNDTNMLKQSNSGSRSTNDVESGVTNDVTRDADVETPSLVNEVEHSLNETSPLHVMFYGSSNCKLDSYSVLNAQNQVDQRLPE